MKREFKKEIRKSTIYDYLKRNDIVLKKAKKRLTKSSSEEKKNFQSNLKNMIKKKKP